MMDLPETIRSYSRWDQETAVTAAWKHISHHKLLAPAMWQWMILTEKNRLTPCLLCSATKVWLLTSHTLTHPSAPPLQHNCQAEPPVASSPATLDRGGLAHTAVTRSWWAPTRPTVNSLSACWSLEHGTERRAELPPNRQSRPVNRQSHIDEQYQLGDDGSNRSMAIRADFCRQRSELSTI